MKTETENKKQFDWSKIPLGTFSAIDVLSKAKVTDEIQRDITLLHLITRQSESYYEQIPLSELQIHRTQMHNFLNTQMEGRYQKYFWCKGRKYMVSETMEEFNGAQLEGISLLKLTAENFGEKASLVMAILSKEKFVWYKFWQKKLSIKETAKLFDEFLPTSIGIGISNFFFLYSHHLLPLVLEAVQKEAEEMMTN